MSEKYLPRKLLYGELNYSQQAAASQKLYKAYLFYILKWCDIPAAILESLPADCDIHSLSSTQNVQVCSQTIQTPEMSSGAVATRDGPNVRFGQAHRTSAERLVELRPNAVCCMDEHLLLVTGEWLWLCGYDGRSWRQKSHVKNLLHSRIVDREVNALSCKKMS